MELTFLLFKWPPTALNFRLPLKNDTLFMVRATIERFIIQNVYVVIIASNIVNAMS